jgi:MFS family permease
VLTTTPIDAHLPLVIALVLACAWAARGTGWAAIIQCAVPLLIAAMMTIADERSRLMAYGIIVAAAFAVAVIATAYETERWRLAGWPGGVSPPMVVLAVVGVILLRWIPLRDVHVVKELIVVIGSIVLLFVVQRRDAAEPAGGTPAFLCVLLLAAVTPIPPGKMALLPLTVAVLVFVTRRVPQVAIAAFFLICAFFARYSLATIYIAVAIVFLTPLLNRVKPLTYATAVAIFALWPWSGIIARALPIVRNYEPAGDVRPVGVALAPSEARTIDVPPHVRHAVVTMSGGQMARLKRGRVIGTIEATDTRGNKTTRAISIGDIADFGCMRREQFFASRNPLPRFSPGEIRDYGAKAWMWGAGRTAIASAADMKTIRVIAAPNLPHDAHLQIDSVEFPAR